MSSEDTPSRIASTDHFRRNALFSFFSTSSSASLPSSPSSSSLPWMELVGVLTDSSATWNREAITNWAPAQWGSNYSVVWKGSSSIIGVKVAYWITEIRNPPIYRPFPFVVSLSLLKLCSLQSFTQLSLLLPPITISMAHHSSIVVWSLQQILPWQKQILGHDLCRPPEDILILYQDQIDRYTLCARRVYVCDCARVRWCAVDFPNFFLRVVKSWSVYTSLREDYANWSHRDVNLAQRRRFLKSVHQHCSTISTCCHNFSAPTDTRATESLPEPWITAPVDLGSNL